MNVIKGLKMYKNKQLPAEVVDAAASVVILLATLIAAGITSYFIIDWMGWGINPGFFIGLAIPFIIIFLTGRHYRYIKTIWFYLFKYDGNGFPDDTYQSEEQKSAHGVINTCNGLQNPKKKKIKSLLDD